MKAKSIRGKSSDEIWNRLGNCMVDGFKPTLAIVFLSIKQDREAICNILSKKDIAIFGATTNGEFTDGQLEKESIVVLLLEINPTDFSIYLEEYTDKNYREVTQSIAQKALERFKHPTFLIAGNHMETDAEQLLFGFEDIIGKQVNVYGGLDEITEDNEHQAIEIATNFPLQLQREKGEPVMRPGLLIDWNDGSFYCSGSVPQGSKVRFSLPPDFDVIEKVVHGCEELKGSTKPDADAVVVFSCAGRLMSLGPLMTKEIEGVKNVWDAPMAGFFSNAELARATDGNLEMHNLTTCCVVLKEK